MKRFTGWRRQVPAVIRKPIVLIAGTVIVLGGIILIPLPGPSWVIIFVGLALPATEFAAAEKLRGRAIHKGQKLFSNLRKKLASKLHKKSKA